MVKEECILGCVTHNGSSLYIHQLGEWSKHVHVWIHGCLCLWKQNKKKCVQPTTNLKALVGGLWIIFVLFIFTVYSSFVLFRELQLSAFQVLGYSPVSASQLDTSQLVGSIETELHPPQLLLLLQELASKSANCFSRFTRKSQVSWLNWCACTCMSSK